MMEKIVKANGRLVLHVINEYYESYNGNDDVLMEGLDGLMRAAKNFDPAEGVAFSTYAARRISSRISTYIRENYGCVRLPQKQYYKVKKIRTAILQMQQDGYAAPSDKEVSDRIYETNGLRLAEAEVGFLRTYANEVVSINAAARTEDGDGAEMGDLLVSDGEESAEEKMENVAVTAAVLHAINSLQVPEQADVIKRYHGLGEYKDKPQSFEEIARETGRSKAKVNSEYRMGIRSLKHPSRASKLREFI